MIYRSFVNVLATCCVFITLAQVLYAKAVDCQPNGSCTVELKDAVCADGTPMFVNITTRVGAQKLYIYMQGGGACWDAFTCDCRRDGHCAGGFARNLTRPNPELVHSGWSNPTVPFNPISLDYNIVEIPYCTGDLFIGNRLQEFGSAEHPSRLSQFGYHNMTVSLTLIKKLFPNPENIVLMGSSAGGLGAVFNLHQVKRFYPQQPVQIISDSGAPFKLPFVSSKGLQRLISSWGVLDNVPDDYGLISPGDLDFAGMLRYNSWRYPDHKYAFVSSYNDWVMTGFSMLLGAEFGFSTISRMIQDVAAHDLGEKQKVFYVSGDQHTFHNTPPSGVVAGHTHLGDWIGRMINNQPEWTNQL